MGHLLTMVRVIHLLRDPRILQHSIRLVFMRHKTNCRDLFLLRYSYAHYLAQYDMRVFLYCNVTVNWFMTHVHESGPHGS